MASTLEQDELARLQREIADWRLIVDWVWTPFEFVQVANLLDRLARGVHKSHGPEYGKMLGAMVQSGYLTLIQTMRRTAPDAIPEEEEFGRVAASTVRGYAAHLGDTTAFGRASSGFHLLNLFNDIYQRMMAYNALRERPGL